VPFLCVDQAPRFRGWLGRVLHVITYGQHVITDDRVRAQRAARSCCRQKSGRLDAQASTVRQDGIPGARQIERNDSASAKRANT
jgi:hypothetical protein